MNESSSVKLISARPLEEFVTVLAIHDDVPSSSGPSRTFNYQPQHFFTPPTVISVNPCDNESDRISVKLRDKGDEIVEVTSLDDPPSYGLRISDKAIDKSHAPPQSDLSANILNMKVMEPSEMDYYRESGESSKVNREISSVSVDPSPNFLSRNNARKSRFTDAFLDAKERLDQQMEHGAHISDTTGAQHFRHSKIVLSPDTVNTFVGVEISAVPDPVHSNRIVAVEVIQIEEGGRVAQDGRLKIGDQITEINGQKCSQMSLAKARLLLRDIETIDEPSLAFNRQIQSTSDNAQAVVIKPIKTALQQGNTSGIGKELSFTIKKGAGGFGFSYASRLNAEYINLFYVKTIKPDGPSNGLLKIGDRLLKIDGTDLSSLQQFDVKAMLMAKSFGETIEVLISRMVPDDSTHDAKDTINDAELLGKESKNWPSCSTKGFIDFIAKQMEKEGRFLVDVNIALNNSPSAGLGINLKAQKIYRAALPVDSGIYVNSILHGSASFKDGRLRKDDRLVAVENVNLLEYAMNAEAYDAFKNCLAQMPSDASSVRVIVARKLENSAESDDSSAVCRAIPARVSDDIADNAISSVETVKQTTAEESESEASIVPDPDSFNRDVATRKSISEKRPFGIHNDPSHLETYQRIKHFRQTSAPALNSFTRFSSLPTATERKLAITDCSAIAINNSNRRRSLGNKRLNRRLSIPPSSLSPSSVLTIGENFPGAENCRRRPLTVYQDRGMSQYADPNYFCNNEEVSMIFDEKIDLCVLPDSSPIMKKSSSSASKFFDFFRASANKKSMEEEAKENIARDKSAEMLVKTSPRSRSKSNEITRSTRLSLSNIKKKDVSFKDSRVSSEICDLSAKSIPNSMSQPILGTNNFERFPSVHIQGSGDHKKNTTATSSLPLAVKRQRRKSTGSGFLKMFQKSESPTELRSGDEMNAAKHNMLMNDRLRIQAMDETFRKEFGISRNDEPKKLCNEKRRPPPPAYHQIHPSISMGYADGLCGDNNNGVHHQRVRSMHESPASFLQQTTITSTAATSTTNPANNNISIGNTINNDLSPSSCLLTIKMWNDDVHGRGDGGRVCGVETAEPQTTQKSVLIAPRQSSDVQRAVPQASSLRYRNHQVGELQSPPPHLHAINAIDTQEEAVELRNLNIRTETAPLSHYPHHFIRTTNCSPTMEDSNCTTAFHRHQSTARTVPELLQQKAPHHQHFQNIGHQHPHTKVPFNDSFGTVNIPYNSHPLSEPTVVTIRHNPLITNTIKIHQSINESFSAATAWSTLSAENRLPRRSSPSPDMTTTTRLTRGLRTATSQYPVTVVDHHQHRHNNNIHHLSHNTTFGTVPASRHQRPNTWYQQQLHTANIINSLTTSRTIITQPLIISPKTSMAPPPPPHQGGGSFQQVLPMADSHHRHHHHHHRHNNNNQYHYVTDFSCTPQLSYLSTSAEHDDNISASSSSKREYGGEFSCVYRGTGSHNPPRHSQSFNQKSLRGGPERRGQIMASKSIRPSIVDTNGRTISQGRSESEKKRLKMRKSTASAVFYDN